MLSKPPQNTRAACRLAVLVVAAAAAVLLPAGRAAAKDKREASWPRCLKRPDKWFASDEAVRVADNLLLYQRAGGGWPKNIDMAKPLSPKQQAALEAAKKRADATLDNGATHSQLRFLARVYTAGGQERFKAAFLRGLDAVLSAQHANGGWPQRLGKARGYARYVTFNDGAMIGAMGVLRDVARRRPAFAFVDAGRRERSRLAVDRGIDCILKCQIVVRRRRTAWCQQHDDKTLAPRPARSFEPAALCGAESVGVVEFLMGVDKPSRTVVEAVHAAVAWLDAVKLTGIRQVTRKVGGKADKVIVKDAAAPPVWARFYEIGTNRPLFGDRDGKVHYTMTEISHERRTGYAWYGRWPARLLEKSYPAWRKKHPRAAGVPKGE